MSTRSSLLSQTPNHRDRTLLTPNDYRLRNATHTRSLPSTCWLTSSTCWLTLCAWVPLPSRGDCHSSQKQPTTQLNTELQKSSVFFIDRLSLRKNISSKSLPLIPSWCSLVRCVSHDHSWISSKESGIVLTGPDAWSFSPGLQNSSCTSCNVLKMGVRLTKWSGKWLLSGGQVLPTTLILAPFYGKQTETHKVKANFHTAHV